MVNETYHLQVRLSNCIGLILSMSISKIILALRVQLVQGDHYHGYDSGYI